MISRGAPERSYELLLSRPGVCRIGERWMLEGMDSAECEPRAKKRTRWTQEPSTKFPLPPR